MAYNKQIFTQGQVLTASHLNHIENGIAQSDAAITTLKTTTDTHGKAIKNTDTRVTNLAGQVGILGTAVTSALSSLNTHSKNARNAFGNAIVGTAVGSHIALTDVSPIEHDVKVIVNNFGSSEFTKLIVSGKNLIDTNTLSFTQHEVVELPVELPPGIYTLSAHIESTDTDRDIVGVSFLDNAGTVLFKAMQHGNSTVTITVDKAFNKIDFCAAYNYSEGVSDTATWSDIQLEVGEIASEFEEYREVTEYAVANNAREILVTSKAPSMTVFSDTGDAELQITYNRDTTAVVNDLLERVSALENA